jgi:hypothetical protein
MTYYGIFNQNDNYKLLRYSNAPQDGRIYQVFDYPTKTYTNIVEVCLPDIEYLPDNIGKFYNLETQTFFA